MSMLGFDILKNSLTEKHVNSASEALNYLNGRLTRILRTTSGSQVRDGMDIAFCVLDPESLKLYFSGANNPCWIIKKDKTFVELKPDKQPIGFFEKSSPFTLKSVQLEQGDMFYLFTDGFADQFGGPKGKKFKYRQLNDLLSQVSDLPMNEQREAVSNAFANWKGKLEQIDDVCIIGIRIS
jgi:serine phosphatase RsbU (regulator of sigma subunit)